MTEIRQEAASRSEADLRISMQEKVRTEIEQVSAYNALQYNRYLVNIGLAVLSAVAGASHANMMNPFAAFLIFNLIFYGLQTYYQRYRTQQFLLTDLRFHYDFHYSRFLAGRISGIAGLLLLLLLHPTFMTIGHYTIVHLLPAIFFAAALIIPVILYFTTKESIRKKILYGDF